MVRAGALVFPREVFDELAREHRTWKDERSDEPYDWAKRTRETATRHGTDYGAVKRVLATAAAVLDHEKVGGADKRQVMSRMS